jgi:hypothetical protein
MVARWCEGFETHQIATQFARKYATATGTPSISSGRVFGSSSGVISLVLAVPSFGLQNTLVHGFGVRIASQQVAMNSGSQGFYFEKTSLQQVRLEFVNNALSFEVRLMRGATQLAITTATYAYAVWHYFEWKVTMATGAGGSYEIRHNGVAAVSASGVNTANVGTNDADSWAMRFSSNLGINVLFDDMYVVDTTGATNNDFLGPVLVEGRLPNGAGTTTQWTNDPAVGSNFNNVDDPGDQAPDDSGGGGTNSSDTSGQKDTYAYEDLTQVLGAIHFIQLGTQLAMAAAGSRDVKTRFRDNGGSEADIATHTVALTAYDEFVDIMDLNPQSAAAWDVSDIQGGEFGVVIV